MYILAIETTGAFASVAFAEASETGSGCRILAHVEGHDRYSHLQNLTPQISQVLAEAGSSIGDVSAIAVANGPGSFTGIRIGVSTSRALSQIKGMPCVPVSSLEALALRAQSDEAAEGVLICPILDARRNQVYGAGYLLKQPSGEDRDADGAAEGGAAIPGVPELQEVVKAGPYTIDEFMELVSGYDQIYQMGDGVDTCREKIEAIRTEGIAFAPEESRYQRAEEVAAVGATKFARGEAVTYDGLEPEYMRMAEAERKLRAKQAEERAKQGRSDG